jgi:hypothetical protein
MAKKQKQSKAKKEAHSSATNGRELKAATNDVNVWFIVAALSVLGGCLFQEWEFGVGIAILLTCALKLNPGESKKQP